MTAFAGAAHERQFVQPALMRKLSGGGLVLSAAATLATLVLMLEPDRHNVVLLAGCLLLFAGCGWLSVAMMRSSRDTIVVRDDGLACRSPDGSTVLIPWREIGSVEAQNVMQRLVVSDREGRRRIHLEYHLENFGELRRIVLERTGHA